VTIRYEVRGTGDPTLVLVHGWTNSRAIWGQHPETLAKSHRVVALDLAGHGISDADRADWTVEAFGQDVVAVADRLGLDRIVLVGFSMGGPVIIEAADQLGDRVDGLVFVDTVQDPDTFLGGEEALEQMVAAMRANWNDPALIRAFGFTPDAPDSLIDYAIRIQPEELAEYQVTVLYAVHDWVGAEMKRTLERLDVPIAAINTTNEPTNVEALRRYDPGFTVDTIEGVGHAGILLQRVDDFDARLLAIVDRFEAERAAADGGDELSDE
jgi:pimeloyl-ACP methyl ester carboxylesterase